MTKFEIYSVSCGWISGKIIVGETLEDYNEYYFNYSYLSDFLDDFLKCLLAVNNSLEDNSDLDTFTAHWEPSVDDWKLRKQEETLCIDINSYTDDTRQEKLASSSLKCNYDKFVNAVATGLTDIIKKIGFYGYRTEWEKEFPLSLYLKLTDTEKAISLTERTLEETQGAGGFLSDYIVELELLQRNIENKIDKEKHIELISILEDLVKTIELQNQTEDDYLLTQNFNEAKDWLLYLKEHTEKSELKSLENEISQRLIYKYDVQIGILEIDDKRTGLMHKYISKSFEFLK